jgi:hypothetical protein
MAFFVSLLGLLVLVNQNVSKGKTIRSKRNISACGHG